jgi:AhpC/TSA family
MRRIPISGTVEERCVAALSRRAASAYGNTEPMVTTSPGHRRRRLAYVLLVGLSVIAAAVLIDVATPRWGRARVAATLASVSPPPPTDGDRLGAVKVSPVIASKDERSRLRVGELLGGLTFVNATGKRQPLVSPKAKVTVVVARDVDCPVAKRYGPRLAELEQEFSVQGSDVAFVYLFATGARPIDELQKNLTDYRLRGTLAADADHALARAFALRSTTEVFVIDQARTLRYRGAIDDQYGLGYQKSAAQHHYLRDAVRGVLAGRNLGIPATTAPGCLTEYGDADAGDTSAIAQETRPLTYHDRISRIVQLNCEVCHRAGGAAPFALDTYSAVVERKAMIRYVVEQAIMPPWGLKSEPGKWLNDQALSTKDKTALLTWLREGAVEGNRRDAPLPLTWPTDWQIGTPDLVVQLPKPVVVPASGALDYVYVTVKNPLHEDRWVKAMELRPTAPGVVHHINVLCGDAPARWDDNENFTRLVPGETTSDFGPDRGKRLPAGATLSFQIHYAPNGMATTDQTQLGFVFHDKKPDRAILSLAAATSRFEIPPGAEAHQVVAEYAFNEGRTLLSFSPHMHVRGKAFRYELLHPDGRVIELVDVPRYDFNWQLRYRLAKPLYAPAGSRIRTTAWYDNSAKNPANPDPTQTVRYGEQTRDEMMIGYFEAE